MLPVLLFVVGLIGDRNMLFVSTAFLVIFAVVNDIYTLLGMRSLLTLSEHVFLFGALGLGLLCRYLLKRFSDSRRRQQ